MHFTTPIPSLAECLAADAQGARVVKAFNTVPSKIIELDREKLASHRVSVLLCSDDPPAKSVVSGLAEELGFVSVGSGELERAQLLEAVPTSSVFRYWAWAWACSRRFPFVLNASEGGTQP